MKKNLDKNDVKQSVKAVSSSSHFVDTLGIFKIIFLLLLLVMVFRALSGVNSITFTGFLTWLRDFHPLLGDFQYIDLTIVGDWGLFEFLRNFINLFTQVISVAVFLCKAIINFISYIFGFVRFLFLF